MFLAYSAPVGGYCSDSDSCICNVGYTGDNCTIGKSEVYQPLHADYQFSVQQTLIVVGITLRVRMVQHATTLDLISMSVCVQQGLRETVVRGRQMSVTPTPA